MPSPAETEIAVVTSIDLPDLLPLMRAYCHFYAVEPTDTQLERLARALVADPAHEGVQLLARRDTLPVGFATCFWTWETTHGNRVAIMNDLYVDERARGLGIGRALLEACRDLAAQHGATRLSWQTAPDNVRAQHLYDTTGAARATWLTYNLDLDT
ncbi:MAG TPA: GNAT family N-acetyltransferase [Jiangellaceae bacterium]|nr:GNAT family N-acetyltransferase [Jiangellaceae bacterium]